MTSGTTVAWKVASQDAEKHFALSTAWLEKSFLLVCIHCWASLGSGWIFKNPSKVSLFPIQIFQSLVTEFNKITHLKKKKVAPCSYLGFSSLKPGGADGSCVGCVGSLGASAQGAQISLHSPCLLPQGSCPCACALVSVCVAESCGHACGESASIWFFLSTCPFWGVFVVFDSVLALPQTLTTPTNANTSSRLTPSRFHAQGQLRARL